MILWCDFYHITTVSHDQWVYYGIRDYQSVVGGVVWIIWQKKHRDNSESDTSVAVLLYVLVIGKKNKQTQDMVYQQKQHLNKCLNAVCCGASSWHSTAHGEQELDIGHSNKSIVSTDPWGDQFAPPPHFQAFQQGWIEDRGPDATAGGSAMFL